MNKDVYLGWGFLTGILIFIGVWIYALTQWGFLWGIMFGWIPAIITAVIAGFLWPVPMIAAVLIGMYIFNLNKDSAARQQVEKAQEQTKKVLYEKCVQKENNRYSSSWNATCAYSGKEGQCALSNGKDINDWHDQNLKNCEYGIDPKEMPGGTD